MIIPIIAASEVASSGLNGFVSQNIVASASRLAGQSVAQTNQPLASPVDIQSADSGLVTKVTEADRWSAKKNVRFKELARAEAMRDLSIIEQAELEKLTRLRRFEVYPRSADEILWERREQSITGRLLSVLKEYVEFHEAPRNS